ncbi:MAG: RNase H family protein [Myxococcota bacterium]
MGLWKRATFKDGRVFAAVDAAGALAARGGRVPIRYSESAHAKVYEASVGRVTLEPDAPPIELPEPVAAEPAAPTKKRAPSGFGSAGTRTAAQSAAARADARDRIAGLAPGTAVAYADGSCRGNPGPAGSGALVVLADGRKAEATASLGRSTNNVAELTAVALVLDLLDEAELPPDAPAVLFSDSSYADGVLCRGWKAKANTELILGLRARLAARPGLRLEWVAGHVGIEGNERADALANDGVAGVNRRSGFASR